MHPKHLLKKWPSLSAAAAMLLGFQRAEATPGDIAKTEDLKTGDPFEPLILKPAKTKIIPEHLFAGHRSHSSHSSHSSGSSGRVGGSRSRSSGTSSGYYVPPAPSYVPTATPRPAYSVAPYATPRPNYSPSLYATPAATPRASPTPTPVSESVTRLDLTNGAVIYGTVLAKSAAGITFKGVDQKNYKIPRLILAASTITALRLPEEQ